MKQQDYEMTEQETTMDILKNPEKYEHKRQVGEMISLLSAACGLVNQNPEVFDYHTYRKPLEELLRLCIDNDYRLNQ